MEGLTAGAPSAAIVTDILETSDIEIAIDASPTGVGSGAGVGTTASSDGKYKKSCWGCGET